MRPDDWRDAVLPELVIGFAEMTTVSKKIIDLRNVDSM
jgi:hypothetical protein